MKAIIIVLCILMTGCATTKEQRRSNRAARKLERLVERFPELSRTDTIHDTLSVVVPSIEVDTVLLRADTISISKDRWHVEIINTTDSVYISGGCETDTITVYTETLCDTIQPTVYRKLPLNWWQKTLIALGIIFLLIFVLIILKQIFL